MVKNSATVGDIAHRNFRNSLESFCSRSKGIKREEVEDLCNGRKGESQVGMNYE